MKMYIIVGAIAASALASLAGAQAQPGEHRGPRPDMTRQQATQFADSMFQRLDANHDGLVTRAEAEQAAQQMGGGKGGEGRAGHMIDRAFGDAQSLSQAQFETKALARFDGQDLNHDGVVSAAEREQAHANRQNGK
jgi:hypothetical protein